MKNKFMIIDYGKEKTKSYTTYDLWDEYNDTELKNIKISNKYVLSTGDIININDINNINDIILELSKVIKNKKTIKTKKEKNKKIII